MKSRRVRISVLMLVFMLSVCATAKLTSDAVKQEMEKSVYLETTSRSQSTETDELIQFRTEREQLRQMQKSQLNDIIYATGSDGEIILSAQTQLLKILETEATELTVEGILKMRGFKDAIVTINGESVNVLVRSDGLTSQETAVILELIVRETGIFAGNVKIIPIN